MKGRESLTSDCMDTPWHTAEKASYSLPFIQTEQNTPESHFQISPWLPHRVTEAVYSTPNNYYNSHHCFHVPDAYIGSMLCSQFPYIIPNLLSSLYITCSILTIL